ncbi:MAG: hypothetical protein WBM04_00715 [Candidatus Korobacteraceae bacterium]
MMALTDASRHDWLEGRGPQFTLIGLQDDATGQILAADFQLEAENTVGYLRTLRVYRGDSLLFAQPLPLQEYSERRPAPRTTAQKPKPKMPRIYNLSGRPALAAVTQMTRGDIILSQLIRHIFLVATTIDEQ